MFGSTEEEKAAQEVPYTSYLLNENHLNGTRVRPEYEHKNKQGFIKVWHRDGAKWPKDDIANFHNTESPDQGHDQIISTSQNSPKWRV